MNVIDASGVLAISTRLQRLADLFRKDGQQVYAACGIAFEPKWFPVIYTLYHKPGLSVVELAGEIGYAHPSTISLLKELEKEKLIRSKKDKHDERKRLLHLSEKGEALVAEMKPVWAIIARSIAELIDTQHQLMKAIEEAERRYAELSFFDRAKPHIAALRGNEG